MTGCDKDKTVYMDKEAPVYTDRNITVFDESSQCTVQEFNSFFIGRIVYEDGLPYKRGAVKAVGTAWESYAVTDDNGTFRIGVQGDDRFFFSAYSPFGDYQFYSYEYPLIVAEFSESEGFVCEYGYDTVDCYIKAET